MTISFTAKAEDLAPQLKWISAGVSRNSESRARLEIDPAEGKLLLKLDNKINSYEGQVDIKIQGDDVPNRKRVIFADGANLIKTQRLLKDGEVTLSVNDNNTELEISTPKANYGVGLYADGKVSSKESVSSPIGTVMANSFNKTLKQVSRAAVSMDMPVLECVCIEFSPENKEIKITATDRFMLAHRVVQYDPNPESSEDLKIVVNAKHISQAAASIDNDAVLNLFLENNGKKIGMSSDDKIAKLGTNDEEFVNYSALLKSEVDTEVTFNKKELVNAITDVRDLGNASIVTLNIDKGKARLLSGTITMDVNAEYTGTEANEIRFSVDKLYSAISMLSTDTVKLQFSPNKKRGVLMKEMKKDKTEEASFIGVVIPSIKG